MISKKSRVRIQQLLRSAGLLGVAEKFRYFGKLWSLKKANKTFVLDHPDFSLPPRDLAFDAYSAPDWDFYKKSGEGTAKFLAATAKKYFSSGHPLTAVYEWGCGPGRVVRQLPGAFGTPVQIFGSDYNDRTIEWCQENIPGVHFFNNQLHPPVDIADSRFDFIYCISVFTHLSEETGLQWAAELHRLLRPEGILLITTSGENAFQHEMLQTEQEKYQHNGVVVRAQYEEGKKMFLARHNPAYVRTRLLQSFEIMEHVPAGFPFIEQDYWIARKSAEKNPTVVN